ncbi:MAG: 4-demethylwyosine synthase TYW1 [Candidatus Aenigmatarchaeota archaeon]|nr:4-demethylwyosine synthase TYW1 [Candidatus Aenigmarchaeota archaeon]
MIDLEYRKRLQKASYKLIGKNMHSAVKLCLWCKKSIKTGGKEVCYKQQFYGIKSHKCIQMTPSLPFCNLRCLHCWRDTTSAYENWKPTEDSNIDSPEEIIEESIKAQKNLLTGLGGVPHSEKFLKEAMTPNQVAISLEGEPMMYPYIDELIAGYKKRNFSVFLVTNGTFPEKIKELKNLPDQLYVSLTSPNEKIFEKIQNPISKNLWNNIVNTLKFLPEIKTRKVIRLTLIRDLNNKNIEEYSELIKVSNVDFVEVKSYMSVGYSTKRLPYNSMLTFEEIKEFSEKLSKLLSWEIKDENMPSRVVLLKNPNGCELKIKNLS